MFEGKVVIVTGGTRGIGLEIARKFAKEKAQVIIFGSKEESVTKAIELLKKEDIVVEGYYPNLNNEAEVTDVINKIYANFFWICIIERENVFI